MPTNPRLDELIGSQNVRLLDELVEFPRTGLQLGVGPYYDNLRGLVVTPARRPQMSILGDVLRSPASPSGRSSSLLGDLIQGGFGLVAGVVGAKAQRRALRQQIRFMRLQQQQQLGGVGPAMHGGGYQLPPQLGGSQVSILDGSFAPPAYQQSGQPYVEPAFNNASFGGSDFTLATGGVALPAVVAGARALAATPAVRALVSFFSRYVAPAAAVEMVSTLLQSGHLDGKRGPYANARDNKVVGILRGDMKAMKRVKRQGARLTKALRMAGVGRRAARGRFRRRAC